MPVKNTYREQKPPDILRLLSSHPMTEDELHAESGMPLQELRAALGVLRSNGFIEHGNGLIWLTSNGEAYMKGERIDMTMVPGLKELVGLYWKHRGCKQ